MSEATEKLKKKHGSLVAKLFEHIELVPEVALTNEEQFQSRSKRESGNALKMLVGNYSRILDSLIYGNNFIGSDYFILRYCTYELLSYWHVVSTEDDLTKEEAGSCKLEVETHFYYYLNCIYNIKEKFETLAGFSKGRIGNIILTNNGKSMLQQIFENRYTDLRKYCEARGDIVHGTYAMKVWEKRSILRLTTFAQDLLAKNIYERKDNVYEFSLKDDDLLRPLEVICDFTKEVLAVLSDLNNVDPDKLADKYIGYEGGAKKFPIIM